MRKRINWAVLLVMGTFMISGCAVALVGVAAVGAGSGTYYYINGEMKTDYYQSFDATWSACQKSVADMRGVDVEQDKEIGNGKIAAYCSAIRRGSKRLIFSLPNATKCSRRCRSEINFCTASPILR